MREINEHEYDDYEYNDYEEDVETKKKRKLKHPGRFIVFIITLIICIWLICTMIISLVSGQKFSVLGASTHPVRNIVVAGVDEGGYRTDLIMFCQINRKSGELNILQIPRDTKVVNKRNDKKINSAYHSGFDCMRSEIEQVTGLKADKYVIVSFDAFNEIIDSIGGVTVDVPVRMNYTDPVQNLVIDLKPGKQKLDGKHAQMFMRFRKNNDGTGYPNGDMDRIEAQKQLYSGVKEKLMTPAGIFKIPSVMSAVMKNSTTNINGGEMAEIMRDVVAVSGNINFYSLPGGGKYINGGSYFVYDKDKTKALIDEHFVK